MRITDGIYLLIAAIIFALGFAYGSYKQYKHDIRTMPPEIDLEKVKKQADIFESAARRLRRMI